MSSDSALITIALPTYNRSSSLGQAIDSLAECLSDCTADVSITVRDNASTDDTQSVLRSAQSRHPSLPLKVIQNPLNLGYDGNHFSAYIGASSAYLWYCSDRYLYRLPLVSVPALIRKYRPGVVTFSHLFNPLLPGHLPPFKALAEILGAEPMTEQDQEFLLTSAGRLQHAGFLARGVPSANVSDCIFLRDDRPERVEQLKSYLDTYMLVVVAQLAALADPGQTVIIMAVPDGTCAFSRMNSGGARHDNVRVAYANVRMARDFPFLGDVKSICRQQLRSLLEIHARVRSRLQPAIEHDFSVSDVRAFLASNGYRPSLLERAAMSALELRLPRVVIKLALLVVTRVSRARQHRRLSVRSLGRSR